MIRGPVIRRLLALVGAIGLTGVSVASGQDGFASVRQAREYLLQNPTGNRAAEAFRVIVDADLAARHPELDPAAIARGSALWTRPGSGMSAAAAEAAIAALAPVVSAELARAHADLRASGSREDSSQRDSTRY